MRGKAHEIEPEADSLSFIDFEDDMPRDPYERFLWHSEMVGCVVGEVLASDADPYPITRTLFLSATGEGGPFDLNETLLWQNVGRYARSQGFDTYDSDSRFELFPGGTEEYPDEEVAHERHERPHIGVVLTWDRVNGDFDSTVTGDAACVTVIVKDRETGEVQYGNTAALEAQ